LVAAQRDRIFRFPPASPYLGRHHFDSELLRALIKGRYDEFEILWRQLVRFGYMIFYNALTLQDPLRSKNRRVIMEAGSSPAAGDPEKGWSPIEGRSA
jgi:hypothetical protein